MSDTIDMGLVINATPHPIAVLAALFESPPTTIFDGAVRKPVTVPTVDGPAYLFEPSGFRLAADVIGVGPVVGGAVCYQASGAAHQEARRIMEIMSAWQGVSHWVIASEISCRAMVPTGALEDNLFQVRMVWPVLAPASLTLPPGERWASRLAAVQWDGRPYWLAPRA